MNTNTYSNTQAALDAAWDAVFPTWSYALGGDCDDCDDFDAAISIDTTGTRRCETCALDWWHELTD